MRPAARISGSDQRPSLPSAGSRQGPELRGSGRAVGWGGPGLTDGVDGLAEGQKEAQPAVEQRQGHCQQGLQRFLYPSHPGARRVRELLEEIVLPEREDRHQGGPGGAEARLITRPGRAELFPRRAVRGTPATDSFLTRVPAPTLQILSDFGSASSALRALPPAPLGALPRPGQPPGRPQVGTTDRRRWPC